MRTYLCTIDWLTPVSEIEYEIGTQVYDENCLIEEDPSLMIHPTCR
jgi:hypothetical protein